MTQDAILKAPNLWVVVVKDVFRWIMALQAAVALVGSLEWLRPLDNSDGHALRTVITVFVPTLSLAKYLLDEMATRRKEVA